MEYYMKKIIILTTAICLLAACGKNSEEEVISSFFFDNGEIINWDDYAILQGLVAYYAFDGTTVDSSGNNLHASIQGNIGVGEGHRNGTNSAYFNGSIYNYMYVPHNGKLKLDVWTINLWFFCSDESHKSLALMGMGTNKTIGAFKLTTNKIFLVNSTGERQWGTLHLDDDSWYPSINAWHMLTVQVNGKNLTMYLDGDLMWSEYLNADYINKTDDYLYFGNCKWYNSELDSPFKGYIDDVRIYDRILTGKEIKYLYSL